MAGSVYAPCTVRREAAGTTLAWGPQRPLGLRLTPGGRQTAMSGRVPLREARGTLGAWLLGGLWVWALGGLCGLGTAGSPGTPHPCQAPQQWEGRQVLYQQSSGHNSRALLSYDGLNQRVRVLDERKALIPCKRYGTWGWQSDGRGGRGRRALRSGALRFQPLLAPPFPKENFRKEGRLGTAWSGAGPTKCGWLAGTQYCSAWRT